MYKSEILQLFQYNAWSNARVLEAASHVTTEQFIAPESFPHGSLRGTLHHALFAEWVWRNRWAGTPSNTWLKPQDFLTIEALHACWKGEETKLMDFVANVTEEQLYNQIKYVSTEGFTHERVLWETMLHLVNHGTQHKTEAAAMLTSLGHSPGDIDLVVFLNKVI